MDVRIYHPSRSTMQSGRTKVDGWVLEYELKSPRRPEFLMGWIASDDTLNQVKLNFDTSEQAVGFAKKRGWVYTILPEEERIVNPRNYVDNFKYIPPEDAIA